MITFLLCIFGVLLAYAIMASAIEYPKIAKLED